MARGVDGRWELGIGDPSPLGWITVAAYLLVAGLAWRNAAAARRTSVPSDFWLAVFAAMVALGLNKQLDLQSWFGQTGRDLALAQGWYEQRRLVQAGFIVVLAVGAILALGAMRRRWLGLWSEYRGVFVGLALLAFFIVVRAASFHHADALIGFDLGATTFGRALELVGVAAIGLACWRWHSMHARRVRRFVQTRAHNPRAARP